MNIRRPAIAATLVSAIATPAMAADQDTVYLNPFAGYQLFDDKRDLSETDTYGFGIEYRFLPQWAVEASYSRADADRKYTGGESEFDEFRLDGLYYLAGQESAWNPYLAVGAGHADFGSGDSLTLSTSGTGHDETRVNAGVGVRYNLSETLSLRGDLREFHGIDDSTFDTMASLGMSVAFHRKTSEPVPADADGDGVVDANDQCPGTPAGTPVDAMGCELDSDNDGVADRVDECPDTPAGAEVDRKGCELDSDRDGVVNRLDQCPGTARGAEVDDTGCVGETETVETMELSVQFPLDSAVIDDSYDREIRQVADFMEENPETVAEIAGHTDSQGAADYNRDLSQRRAEAVANRLISVHGVSEDRVYATGYGESEPVASNDTAAGRADNRRVEARIQVRR